VYPNWTASSSFRWAFTFWKVRAPCLKSSLLWTVSQRFPFGVFASGRQVCAVSCCSFVNTGLQPTWTTASPSVQHAKSVTACSSDLGTVCLVPLSAPELLAIFLLPCMAIQPHPHLRNLGSALWGPPLSSDPTSVPAGGLVTIRSTTSSGIFGVGILWIVHGAGVIPLVRNPIVCLASSVLASAARWWLLLMASACFSFAFSCNTVHPKHGDVCFLLLVRKICKCLVQRIPPHAFSPPTTLLPGT